MQAVLYLLPLLATFAPTSATPTKALEKRASQCGQFETESTGTYTLGSDLWGEDEGTGSQCSSINGLNDGAVSWSTTWSWEDNTSNVKSYTNVVSSGTSCAQLSAIDSLPTTFDWSYSGTDIRANVAYDTFLGSSCSGTNAYEVMVWLADYGGVDPLSNSGYPPTPSASPTIDGVAWNLIIGTSTDGTFTVYSFVAQETTNSFSGNLMDFYHWLETNEGLSSDSYVQAISAGSEVWTGSDCELSVSAWSISQS